MNSCLSFNKKAADHLCQEVGGSQSTERTVAQKQMSAATQSKSSLQRAIQITSESTDGKTKTL